MPSWWIRNSCRVKSKNNSIDDPIFFFRKSLRRMSLDSKTSSISFSGSSVFSGFDSDIGSDVMEKKAYPLPEPLTDFDEELVMFGPETSLNSSTSTSFTSSSNSSGEDGVDVVVQDLREYERHPCHPLPLPPVSPTKSSQNLQSKWKKGKLLGRGAFGHIYAGFNSESGQMCAIKEVNFISDDQSSDECLKQLNQEIALLSKLSHPNIVQYYGSKLEKDRLSVYLEYVSGGSIHNLLSQYGPFTEHVIQSYTKQILSGLAYLHGRNAVHRDIKGANILVDTNDDIKLIDFGIAKHIGSCSSILSFKGSPYWMAPEVIMNTSGCRLAVDIWSLGCTVLEMATTKPPWSQYEGVAAIFQIANSKDYPEIPSYLSEDGQSFVKLCLQRDPSARPTAAQLLHHPFIQNQGIREVASIDFVSIMQNASKGKDSWYKAYGTFKSFNNLMVTFTSII